MFLEVLNLTYHSPRYGWRQQRHCRPVLATPPTMIHEEGRTARRPQPSRMNADDRLPLDPLGRVEGGDGVVEARDVADVCPQPSVTHPPDDLAQ